MGYPVSAVLLHASHQFRASGRNFPKLIINGGRKAAGTLIKELVIFT